MVRLASPVTTVPRPLFGCGRNRFGIVRIGIGGRHIRSAPSEDCHCRTDSKVPKLRRKRALHFPASSRTPAQVAGRDADDLEHLRGRRLLLKGFSKSVVPALRRTIGVLDSDHGLVGEGLDKFDLFLGEWCTRRKAQEDCTERLTFADKGHARAPPGSPQVCVAIRDIRDRQ